MNNLFLKSVKPPVEPVYWQTIPNENIDCGEENISFTCDDSVLEIMAKVELRFIPDQRLLFLCEQNKDNYKISSLFNIPSLKLHLISSDIDARGYLKGTVDGDKWGFTINRYVVETSPADTNICHVVAHLFNFPNFRSEEHFISKGQSCCAITLKVDGWKIIISENEKTDSILKSLKKNGGFAITHAARIEREDGSAFSSTELNDLLTCFRHYLTFILGRWAGLALPIGYDTHGNKVFEQLNLPQIAPGRWKENSPWPAGKGIFLKETFPGFYKLWQKPLWKKTLKETLYWYSQACEVGRGFGVDTGLILTQAALELLAWTYCVQDKQLKTEIEFDKMAAHKRLRMLFEELRIPLDLPGYLSILDDHSDFEFNEDKPKDGPIAITWARNSLIHPPKTGRTEFQDLAYFDAWKLSLWYIDRVILKLCGYEGEYRNRLKHDERCIEDISEEVED